MNFDQLITAGESNTLEFKASFDKATVESAELNTDNYTSRLRNKLVAEAFYLTGNIEKYGSGFIRIRKALRDYPELSLSSQEVSGGIMLTFAQVEVKNSESQPESQPESLVERVLNILVDGEMAKKNHFRKTGPKRSVRPIKQNSA